MIIVTTETVHDKQTVEVKGFVQGSTVRGKHVGRDIAAGLKGLVGGELKGYTELQDESRQQSTSRMIDQARRMGANAIVDVRFSTNSITPTASEVFCYGTAVVVQ